MTKKKRDAKRNKLGKANRAIRVCLEPGALPPSRAHSDDAGMDLYAREDAVVPARGSKVFDTGVRIEIPKISFGGVELRTAGFLKSKSGLNIKHDIISDGTIDVGYNGCIAVKLYNLGDKDYEIKRGEKITQICVVPVLVPKAVIVEKLEDSERGEGGFGSTGK